MARSSPQDQIGTSPKPIPGGLDHAAPETACHRVVSVSPHAAGSIGEGHAAVSYPINEAQTASHKSADSLRALIAEATTIAERFERIVSEARQEEARTASSTARLQERLQLSAQMLKAFQSQITRVEISLAELKAQEKKAQVAEARAQQRLNDMETRIESSLDRFSKRLDEMSQAAFDRIEVQWEKRWANDENAPSGKTDDRHAIVVDLSRLSATIHDIARKIGQLASPGTSRTEGGADRDDDDSAPKVRTSQTCDPAPEVHVAAPLRFQSWVSG